MNETKTWTFSQMCTLTAATSLGPLVAKEDLILTLVEPNMEDVDGIEDIPSEILEDEGEKSSIEEDISAEEYNINDISIIASGPATTTPPTTPAPLAEEEFSIRCDSDEDMFDDHKFDETGKFLL